jgi:molybdopterin synthase catalytic subunit
MDIRVSVQHEPFNGLDDSRELGQGRTDIGAVVCFTGLVRDFNESPDVTGLTLEHYPGMTEAALTAMRESMHASTVTGAHLEAALLVVRPSLDPAQVATLAAYAERRAAR